jgi:peptidyl-prolyl cis-trans isomerase SurA
MQKKNIKSLLFLCLSAACVLNAGAHTPVYAQDSQESSIVVRGQTDPKLRKAAAIINGAVITDLDVDHRLALTLLASGTQLPGQEILRLRAQILRNLIDEQLQIHEAKRQEITISDTEVEEAYTRVAQNFQQTPDQLNKVLLNAGSSPTSLKQQIRAELAWGRVLRRRVEPFVNVGDDEVEAIITRLKASRGQDEYRLSEIFIAVTGLESEARTRAEQIMEQLRAGASFIAYARQFSQSATAAVGGDRGFVAGPQLDPALKEAAEKSAVNDIIGPIAVANGFYILQLNEKRKILAADPLDATISAKQISIAFEANSTMEQKEALITRLGQETRAGGGCGRVDELANKLGAQVSEIPQARIRDLPQGLQRQIVNMQIGQATDPFGTRQDARVVILCGRDEAQEQEPNFDAVMEQISEQRIGLQSRRYMRDLRSEAIVDIR